MERGQLADLLAPLSTGALGNPAMVDEADPSRFMASFAGAVSGKGDVFLANPAWRDQQRAEASRLSGMAATSETGWLMIPSGGAAGGLKFARHDGRTIEAAVRGFCIHFGVERVNSVGVLPLHHVSGFMAWMRSLLTGGNYMPWSWRDAESGRYPSVLPEHCCLSLVPTQLKRLLPSEQAVEWLRKFRVIFVGGASAWGDLVEEAARLGLPLSTGYGATETAAMATALRPEQFLDGVRGCGGALSHATVEIVDGIVRVSGESIFRGYFPETRIERSWTSGDLGTFRDGSLVILGRRDDMIVTGGKKVSPGEVEAALMASGEFSDIAVIGLPDPEWGQAVVACHPQDSLPPKADAVKAALSGLESYKHPKRYAVVSPWPRNAQGKIDRLELAHLASLA
jgi:O-succinylbenzoic acid--CoA ligase